MGNTGSGNIARLRYTIEKFQENKPAALKSFKNFPENVQINIKFQQFFIAKINS